MKDEQNTGGIGCMAWLALIYLLLTVSDIANNGVKCQ